MAFDFLGTLSLEQLRDLRNFLEAEIEFTTTQINTLRVELDNVNRVKADFIDSASNNGYDVLENLYITELPDIVRIPRQDDVNSASIVEKIKKPFISNIKFKRERIEYKVKKLMDVEEQLKEQIDRRGIAKDQTIEMLNEVERLFNEENSNHLFQTKDDLNNFRRGIF